jgi:cobalt-zinc-cadmium efflux system outer membrane protein
MITRHRARTCALLAALAVAGLRAHAQPAPGPHSSLPQAFEAAWARHPEQRAASARRETGDAAQRAAQRWTPEPASLSLSTQTDRPTQNHGSREYEATVAVPLWRSGERGRAQEVAASMSADLQARQAAARWRLAGELREAHWDWQRALADRALADQRLANTRQLAADVARRVQAGDLARADGHQAEAAVAAAESARAEATAARLQAAQRWSALTGQLPSPVPDDSAEPMPDAAPADRPHPALQELSTRAELARRQRELMDRQTHASPELSIGAARERSEFGERYSQSVIVGLRIPLGAQAESPARRAAARAEQAEAEALLEALQARVQADAQAARDQVDALTEAHAAAERRARLALESRGFFEKSFRLGESDLPTRLRVELDALEAQRQAARARIEHAAALSRWRQALGLLPD